MMIHGYYIAATRKRFGDRRMSATAARAWRRLGHKVPGRQAGAAAWLEDERMVIRTVVNDLFVMTTVSFPPSPKLAIARYIVRDVQLPSRQTPSISEKQGGQHG